MPFLLMAVYLFFENRQAMTIPAWAFLVIGSLIWLGGGFFLIVFGLYKWPMLILGAIGVALNTQTLLNGLLPNFDVMENYPVYGLIALAILFGITYYRPKTNYLKWREWIGFEYREKFKKPLLFVAGLATLSFKFVALALPFFAINMGSFVKKENIGLIMLFSVIALVLFGLNLDKYNPTTAQINAIQFGINYAKDGNVQNDWSLGHYVKFFGGEPSLRYGPPQSSSLLNPDLNYLYWFECDNRPIISQLDLNADFQRINKFGDYKIYTCARLAK
jgi:hypothetical protein